VVEPYTLSMRYDATLSPRVNLSCALWTLRWARLLGDAPLIRNV